MGVRIGITLGTSDGLIVGRPDGDFVEHTLHVVKYFPTPHNWHAPQKLPPHRPLGPGF